VRDRDPGGYATTKKSPLEHGVGLSCELRLGYPRCLLPRALDRSPAADEVHDGEPETIPLKDRFFTIATAKVSTSASEAFGLGILKNERDIISINPDRRIADAKSAVLELYNDGYTTPIQRNDIKVLGRSALGGLYAGINGMWRGNYATDHDVLVAKKLAYVMCGGDLSEPTLVSEQYLLDLERQAFLSLCGEKKTLERLQSVIKSGKPIRN